MQPSPAFPFRPFALLAAALALAVVAENADAQSAPGLSVQAAAASVFVADPAAGHYVESWTADCANPDSRGAPDDTETKNCVLAVPGGVGVIFAPVLRLNFARPDNGNLLATVAGKSANIGAPTGRGQTVAFTAQPDDDHYVQRWTGDCETANTDQNGDANPDAVGAKDATGGMPKTCQIVAAKTDINVAVVFASVSAADCAADNRDPGTVAGCGGCASDRHWNGTTCATLRFHRADWQNQCATVGGGIHVYDQGRYGPIQQVIAGRKQEVLLPCVNIGGGSDSCFLIVHPDFNPAASASDRDATHYEPNTGAKFCHQEYPDCGDQVQVDPANPFSGCQGPMRTVNIVSATNGAVVATVAGSAVQDGESATSAEPVTFTAIPASDGFYVSLWTGNCSAAANGATDNAGGLPKTCVVPAGASPIQAGAAFAPVANCAAQNRNPGTNIRTCGNCKGGRVPTEESKTCVPSSGKTVADNCESAGWSVTPNGRKLRDPGECRRVGRGS